MNPVRKQQVRTGLWTAGSVLATIAALLLLSTIDNPDGTPWLESSLLGQTLVVVGSISAIVLPSLIGTRRDAAVARDQLENSHVANSAKVSNVRDDLDHKHDRMVEIIEAFAVRVDQKFEAVHAEFRGTRKDIGRVADQADRAATEAAHLSRRFQDYKDASNDRLDTIESTLTGIATVTGSMPVIEQEDPHE